MATTDTKVLFSKGAFDIDPMLSDGLYLRVRGGVLLDGTGYHGIQGAHLLLTASATNYIEASAVGVVSGNVTGFTPGAAPLYEVKMGATTITSCNDWRNADVALGGSAVAMRTEAAALSAGDLVYVSGWDEATGLPLVTKADANASGRQAQFVMRGALAQNTNGFMYTAWRSTATLVTNGGPAEGDPVYLSETAGGWTATAPTAASSSVQVVGHIAVVSGTVGVVEFDVRDFPTINTNDIQADAITGAKIADDQIDSEHYAASSIDNEHLSDDCVDSAEIAAGALDPEHFAALSVETAALASNAATGSKIPNGALGIISSGTAVTVTAGGAGSQEVLASDANNSRMALVTIVATVAAAGDPDLDVGVANALTSVVHDFGVGVWVVGDRLSRLIHVPATEAIVATVNAAGTGGSFVVYVHVITPVLQRANLAADIIDGTKLADDSVDTEHLHNDVNTWLNALRTWMADGMIQHGTIAVSGVAADKFKTTTTLLYTIAGTLYTLAATDNIEFSAADTITGSKFGAWLLEVGVDGTPHTKSVGANQAYDDAATAKAAAIALGPTASHIQYGIITIGAAVAGFTANTTALAVADVDSIEFANLPAVKTLPAAL